MAKLLPDAFEPPPIDYTREDINEQRDAAWKAIEAQGPVLTFPVADGRAVYIVRSFKPLILQWVKWLDNYQSDPALIRGLNVTDVRRRLEARKRMRALFPGPGKVEV